MFLIGVALIIVGLFIDEPKVSKAGWILLLVDALVSLLVIAGFCTVIAIRSMQ